MKIIWNTKDIWKRKLQWQKNKVFTENVEGDQRPGHLQADNVKNWEAGLRKLLMDYWNL